MRWIARQGERRERKSGAMSVQQGEQRKEGSQLSADRGGGVGGSKRGRDFAWTSSYFAFLPPAPLYRCWSYRNTSVTDARSYKRAKEIVLLAM